MTFRPMRPSLATRLVRTPVCNAAATAATRTAVALGHTKSSNPTPTTSVLSDVWFSSSTPHSLSDKMPSGDHGQKDERTVKLGNTIRILHERLPTLLASPLPQEILSPQISLHLFPSTHPHLPTVSGRIAYLAALWTAPVAWGRVPIVGNVKLAVISEHMTRHGGNQVNSDCRDEKLIVKWKTHSKDQDKDSNRVYWGLGANEQLARITDILAGKSSGGKEFCGLFIFEFDEQGRIAKHTIEHADKGSGSERTNRVVSVTDWLLGKVNGHREEAVPSLAWCESGQRKRGSQGGSE